MRSDIGRWGAVVLGLVSLGCSQEPAQPGASAIPVARSPVETIERKQKDLRLALEKFAASYQQAQSPTERASLLSSEPDRKAYFDGFLRFEQENSGTKAGIVALVAALDVLRKPSPLERVTRSPSARVFGSEKADLEQTGHVFERLEQYCREPEIGDFCHQFWSDSPRVEALLRKIISENPSRPCRGQAMLALSNKLIGDALIIRSCRANPDRKMEVEARFGDEAAAALLMKDSESLLREALKLAKDVVQDFGDVPESGSERSGKRSLSAAAAQEVARIELIQAQCGD